MPPEGSGNSGENSNRLEKGSGGIRDRYSHFCKSQNKWAISAFIPVLFDGCSDQITWLPVTYLH